MAFWFHCPICKSKRLATDNIIGRRVRCADCSNFVDVGVPPKESHVDDAEMLRLVEGMITEDALADPQQYAVTGLPHTAAVELAAEELNSIDDPLPDDIVTDGEPIAIEIVEEGTFDSDSNTFDLTSPTVEIIDLQKSESRKPSGSERRAAQTAAGGQPAGPQEPRSKAASYKSSPGDFGDEAPSPPFKSKGTRGEAEMDMTPMVDVTFLLLIFFMVTASFTLQKSMNRPTETTEDPSTEVIESEEDNPDIVQVDIDEFNSFFVTLPEEEPIEAPSEQDLRIHLKNAKEGGSSGISPTKLLIRAHAESFHDKVVTAMDVGTDLDYTLQVQIVEGDF